MQGWSVTWRTGGEATAVVQWLSAGPAIIKTGIQTPVMTDPCCEYKLFTSILGKKNLILKLSADTASLMVLRAKP